MVNINKLKGKIAESGLTLGAFAKKIGFAQNTLSSRLSGRTAFNLDEVEKICLVLGITDDSEKMRIFLA